MSDLNNSSQVFCPVCNQIVWAKPLGGDTFFDYYNCSNIAPDGTIHRFGKANWLGKLRGAAMIVLGIYGGGEVVKKVNKRGQHPEQPHTQHHDTADSHSDQHDVNRDIGHDLPNHDTNIDLDHDIDLLT